MKALLQQIVERVRTSFWFVPGIMVLGGALLTWLALLTDRRWAEDIQSIFPTLKDVSPTGIRSVLSTAGTAVLTLAGLTFSATIVALTMASGQFGARLMRNFIRALPTQVAMGLLLATFVICLLVLRSVRGGDSVQFVPHLAALLAFVATLASLAVFIFFIHHIATSLQADNVIAEVYQDLDEAMERYFPDLLPEDWEEEQASEKSHNWLDLREGESPLCATRSGYVQAIDMEGLLAHAAEEKLTCRVLRRPGQFVHEGSLLLALCAGPDDETELEVSDKLCSSILIGRTRTAAQDAEFGLRQLVEIALRALSPGINDPFTALNCIDYLGSCLSKVARRKLPPHEFTDESETVRIRVKPVSFCDLLDAAFDQIRQSGGAKPEVAIRILEALAEIASATRLQAHLEAVTELSNEVAAAALREIQSNGDRAGVEESQSRVGQIVASRRNARAEAGGSS